ncbi:hypothetical protein RRF57_012886 [Xylaria bambusicola]|uniref:Secreted protein n=1 Tax=Xylaria bambusicola TaxID=326684 RepID=A0AAN7V626_9PEZI
MSITRRLDGHFILLLGTLQSSCLDSNYNFSYDGPFCHGRRTEGSSQRICELIGGCMPAKTTVVLRRPDRANDTVVKA